MKERKNQFRIWYSWNNRNNWNEMLQAEYHKVKNKNEKKLFFIADFYSGAEVVTINITFFD